MNRFSHRSRFYLACSLLLAINLAHGAQAEKTNILFIVSDDTGYGDLGPYGGGVGRGMPTPSIDELAAEGTTFYSFYAQPSCTPGRAAHANRAHPQSQRHDHRGFPGPGRRLAGGGMDVGVGAQDRADTRPISPGKWHLGEDDYALPNAQGYDVMKYVGLYHLNAYTYADPTWFPDMDPETRAMFTKVTKGALSGKAGEKPVEEFKINGQYVDTPVVDGKPGVVGIPFFDSYVEKATMEFLDTASKSSKPFFINVNFMKVHQPNMPAPEFVHKSISKSKYADSVVELDTVSGASWTN
jgi:arylsulfatase A-like enzyme